MEAVQEPTATAVSCKDIHDTAEVEIENDAVQNTVSANGDFTAAETKSNSVQDTVSSEGVQVIAEAVPESNIEKESSIVTAPTPTVPQLKKDVSNAVRGSPVQSTRMFQKLSQAVMKSHTSTAVNRTSFLLPKKSVSKSLPSSFRFKKPAASPTQQERDMHSLLPSAMPVVAVSRVHSEGTAGNSSGRNKQRRRLSVV